MISMRKRSQTALEFLTTYELVFIIIAVILALLYVFINVPKTLLPTQCSFFSGFSCGDLIYTINQTHHTGSTLVVVASDTEPGIVNISNFSASIAGIKSSNGYCAPNSIVDGQELYCLANFAYTPTIGSLYTGSFNINANYCVGSPSQINNVPCSSNVLLGGKNYTFGGALQIQASNTPLPCLSCLVVPKPPGPAFQTCGASATQYIITNQNYYEYQNLNLQGSEAYNVIKMTANTVDITFSGSKQCASIYASGGGNLNVQSSGSASNLSILVPANGNVVLQQSGSYDNQTVYLLGNGNLDITSSGSNNAYNAISSNGVVDITLSGSDSSFGLEHGTGNVVVSFSGSQDSFTYATTDNAYISVTSSGSTDAFNLTNGVANVVSTGSYDTFTFITETVTSIVCNGSHNVVNNKDSTINYENCP